MVINVILLAISMILYWVSLAFKKKSKQNTNVLGSFNIWTICIGLNFIVNIYLFVFLIERWITAGYFPLSNLYESILFLTWCLNTVQLISELKTSSLITGCIITPIQLVLLSFSSFVLPNEMKEPTSLVPALQSTWLMFHVTMMIISYAILIFGSLLSILIILLTNRSEKSDITENFSSSHSLQTTPYLNLSRIDKLPISKSLYKEKLVVTLDIWSYRTIALGYIALTLGILAGAVWANESWGSYWSWDPKETWSFITWLIFTAYLHARLVNNWTGTKIALIGSLGFISIWISYLGVNFLASGLHSYGWVS